MEKIITVLKDHVRVIDTESVKKIEIFDEYGVKVVIKRSDVTEEEWAAFKSYFREF